MKKMIVLSTVGFICATIVNIASAYNDLTNDKGVLFYAPDCPGMLQLSMSYNCSLQPLQCIDQGGNVYKCNFDTSSEYTCGSNYGTVVFHNSDFTKYCQYSLYSHKPDPRSPWDLQLQLDKTLNMNCDNPTTTRDQYRINY